MKKVIQSELRKPNCRRISKYTFPVSAGNSHFPALQYGKVRKPAGAKNAPPACSPARTPTPHPPPIPTPLTPHTPQGRYKKAGGIGGLYGCARTPYGGYHYGGSAPKPPKPQNLSGFDHQTPPPGQPAGISSPFQLDSRRASAHRSSWKSERTFSIRD